MKITSKIIVLLMSVLLPIGFVGCSDDDDDMPNSLGEEAPEFVLGQESVKVKIGPENKVIIDIKQGGGEYDAFYFGRKSCVCRSGRWYNQSRGACKRTDFPDGF